MSPDKKTIGVSAESQRILDIISDKTMYHDQVDSGRFAVAYALARGLEPEKSTDLSTKWNIGSFDSSGDLRSSILAFCPECETPYRYAEGLLSSGLLALKAHIEVQGQLDFELLLEELNQD
jgi:hypothetical protein